MGIRQWINRAAKSAGRGWVRNAKKKWAEKRARKKERELELLREIDTAMTRKPILERMPEPPKTVQEPDDDWFVPIVANPQT
jgi:hypothetical protein